MEKRSFRLKKITLQSMKVFQKHGLTKLDNISLGDAILNICTDEKKLLEIYDAIFEKDQINPNFDINNIDLEEVAAGIGSFLQRLLNPTRA